jgi:rubrerythrin
MAAMSDYDRSKIVSEFEMMKSFELSAHNLYTQIARDPRIRAPRLKDAFLRLAKDEQRHAEIVQEIIDLIEQAL